MGGNASTAAEEGAPATTGETPAAAPAAAAPEAAAPAAAPAPEAPKEEAKKEEPPPPAAETKTEAPPATAATPAPTEEKKEEKKEKKDKGDGKGKAPKEKKEKGDGKASKGKGKSKEGKSKAAAGKGAESTKGKGKEGKGKELFSGPMGSGDGFRLNVKNMGEETTEEQLKELFAPYGTIVSAAVKKKEDGKSRGIGNVTMSSEEEAKKAMEEMNGKEINGKKLSVLPAERRPTEELKTGGKGDEKGKKGSGKGGKPTPQEYQAYQQQQWSLYQQQMYYQQMYYQQMYAQQMQSAAGKTAEPSGDALDPAKEYEGSLKSIRKNGYGFILCKEVNDIVYKDADPTESRDIYIDKALIPEGAKEKDRIMFTVKMEQREKGDQKVNRLQATSAKLIPRSSYEGSK